MRRQPDGEGLIPTTGQTEGKRNRRGEKTRRGRAERHSVVFEHLCYVLCVFSLKSVGRKSGFLLGKRVD